MNSQLDKLTICQTEDNANDILLSDDKLADALVVRQTVQKLSRWSENFPDCLETFQADFRVPLLPLVQTLTRILNLEKSCEN